MPTDWITRTDATLLSTPQIDLLEKKLENRLGITQHVRGLDPKVWWPISRQIYADVAKNGKPDRIDTFNGNYGLNRGLAAATFALACVAAIHWKWLAPKLKVSVRMLSETVRADAREGDIGMQLGEIAKANPGVAIGSYPFFDPQHGPNTNVVLRARDAQKLAQAKRAVEEMLERVRRAQ